MEPRPNRRGNPDTIGICAAAHIASMEPRPNRRGNVESLAQARTTNQASMEPRPNRRGNREKTTIGIPKMLLQWSHVLTDVETIGEGYGATG